MAFVVFVVRQQAVRSGKETPVRNGTSSHTAIRAQRIFVVDRSVVHYGMRQGVANKIFEVHEQDVFHITSDSVVREYFDVSLLISFGEVAVPEFGSSLPTASWKLDPASGLNAIGVGQENGFVPYLSKVPFELFLMPSAFLAAQRKTEGAGVKRVVTPKSDEPFLDGTWVYRWEDAGQGRVKVVGPFIGSDRAKAITLSGSLERIVDRATKEVIESRAQMLVKISPSAYPIADEKNSVEGYATKIRRLKRFANIIIDDRIRMVRLGAEQQPKIKLSKRIEKVLQKIRSEPNQKRRKEK